jgi:homocysteine S-methyltransferase
MENLEKDWFAKGLIDFEYKKYILLDYISRVSKRFSKTQLYPFLADLIFHYKSLQDVRLGDALWSARLLHDAPEVIQQVHTDYLAAGADCIITASYQASIPGFLQQGYSETQAVHLLRKSVELAVTARDEFWAKTEHHTGRLRPLVAASIGPYGASLADGSEYTGHYGLTEDELVAFHRQRWHILAATQADLLACETIPSAVEARALARVLEETPERFAWLSFSCCDEQHISDGSLLMDAIALFFDNPQVVALGINCTPRSMCCP